MSSNSVLTSIDTIDESSLSSRPRLPPPSDGSKPVLTFRYSLLSAVMAARMERTIKIDVARPKPTVALLRHQSIAYQTTRMT